MAQPIPFGDYELIERIAEGGMAEVWRARSRGAAGFQKTLVIKRVLPSLMARPAFAELLVREAKIAARLSHPNIVQIYDLGEEGGGYFIAMEYLEGRDLAAALSYRGGGEPLGLALRLWIAREVARALDFAHRARGDDGKPLHIVHRDISPQNVLLGFQGEVKVADFGIARADEPGLGRGEDPRVLRGKYAYMSPEQARGEPLDRRSDLFSLGVLLFELVTRRRMYQGLTQPQILDAVRRGRLPSWRAAVGDASLVGVIERALALSRDDRYGSAAEVHAELGRVIAERREPVGPVELAAAMATMFPMQERMSPNKLRVDVLLRAYEDATTARDQGRPASRPPPDETAAMPGSVRARAERHRVALLVTAARPGDDEALAEAAEATGGRLVEAAPSLRVVLFGVPPVERPVAQAARGALELRRRLRISGPARVGRVPAVAIVRAVAREQEGELLPLDEPDVERARRLLGDTEAGDLRVEEGLEAELGRDFVLRLHRQGVSVEGFRSRRERSTQRRSPLVGRQSILRELTGRMADAAKGQGGVVHLVGEAGIGKSRLLAELASASAPAAFTFLRARCDESELERPLGALSDLAHDLCGIEPEDMPRERFAKLERLAAMGVRPEHVRAIGGLVGLAYPFAAQRPMRPRSIEVALALHDALVCLARDPRSERRAGRAVVLAIEDVQWMDEVSRQVFPLLVGKPPAALVLLTRRPGLSGPWPEAERTIRLGPIDLEATIQLLRATLGAASIAPALAETVRRESGGAPGWIEQLAPLIADRLAGEGGSARPPSILPIPDAAAAGVAAQTGRLRPLDRSMLRVAAALEGDADVELLFAAEGLVGGTGRGPLRRLLSRHLLVADTPQQARAPAWGGDEADVELPARVRLPSGLFARALLAELDEAELSRLHGRIAATLERLGAAATLEGAERLARHLARSPDARAAPAAFALAAERARDPNRVALLLAEGAELAARGGAPSAMDLAVRSVDAALQSGSLQLAERALRAADAAASEPGAPALAVARARVARLQGRSAEAAEALEAALAHLAPAARAEAARLALRCLIESGRLERAIELGLREAEQARVEPRGRGLVLAELARALTHADRAGDAEVHVSEALALAARFPEAELRAAALAALAASEQARGRVEEAADRYAEAADLVGAHDLAIMAALAALRAGRLDRVEAHAGVVFGATSDRDLGVLAQLVRDLLVGRAPEELEGEASARPVGAFWAAAQWEIVAHAFEREGRRGELSRVLGRAAEHARESGAIGHARELDAWRVRLDSIDAAT